MTDTQVRNWTATTPPALTRQQPWAHAIIYGHPPMDVVSLSWGTTYRGRLYIHAGRSDDPDAPGTAWACGDAFHQHAHGAIIGYVTLADCVDHLAARVIIPASPWRDDDERWHWVLTHPVALRAPLPATGKLGLWRVSHVQLSAMRTLDPDAA